ncbi:MAG TPA: hypothetical protein P5171_05940 [Xanthomonadaceae bacterium]|nr:hypothetical protein [Xanthomonadales bacterium]HPF73097.1 hypothetical protein [Xanthomonadaceae bacterium]HRX99649.1 hypothetical protein [Xanthomonadaceae bacterium]
MKSRSKLKFGAAALGFLALVAGTLAALISAYAVIKARMPYNDAGNYFDGVTVHHAGGEYFYGLLALPFWALTVFAGIAAYRAFKRARRGDQSH